MNTNKYFSIISILSIFIALLLLITISFYEKLAPIVLYLLLITITTSLIVTLSRSEVILKIKIFLFFFSFYLTYTLIQHYILLIYSPEHPYIFPDEIHFYHFSELAVPYLTGEKSFFELFSNWKLPLHELALHTVFSGYIAHVSYLIDGQNTIIIQKMLSPFLGSLLLVFLYLTLNLQFEDKRFTLKATLIYGLFSAVFMYSTPLLRDIDVALAYMIFFYIFLHRFSYFRLTLLFFIAFLTSYLRLESGMVLYGLVLLFLYFYVRDINSGPLKYILYILVSIIFAVVISMTYKKVTNKIISVDQSYASKGIAQSSANSISLVFNKLPFGLSHTAKLLFSQIKPFPFLGAIDRPLEAISGVFWPFIFTMMLYAVFQKNIRRHIGEKMAYLLIVVIVILYLMSSGPLVRRMISVYPIIYFVSLYTFYVLPKQKIKNFLFIYLFGIFSLNLLYHLIKL